jgi:hypothetical protein
MNSGTDWMERIVEDVVFDFSVQPRLVSQRGNAMLVASSIYEACRYVNRETHYVWGRRCLLSVIERDAPPSVQRRLNRLTLAVRTGADAARPAEILGAWYRNQLRAAAEPVIGRWERRLGVRAERIFVQRMKTRWGSCNTARRAIRLNTDLAKKPAECLEYIIVHELLHLIEPTHSARFVGLMDQHLPGWSQRRALLNRLPVRHEDWRY